ncbi:MAG: TrkA family potassium uptake protein [Acidaminobacteraceae bacterium]
MNKQFVVIGCGRFGSSVAKKLYDLGAEVMTVDKNEETVQNIADFVTYAVQADATDENTIKSLGIRNFDVAVVSIGGDIQSSILVTLMLKELGVKYVVAKAQNDLHGKVLYRIGADRVVFPEREMGIRVASNLVSDNILEYIQLAPDYSIMEIVALSSWIGKTLKELDMRNEYGINVMAIKHGDEIDITISAGEVLEEGDVLVVIGHNDNLEKIRKS